MNVRDISKYFSILVIETWTFPNSSILKLEVKGNADEACPPSEFSHIMAKVAADHGAKQYYWTIRTRKVMLGCHDYAYY